MTDAPTAPAKQPVQVKITTEAPPPTLREQAYALRFNPDIAPPPDEVCMMLGEVPIASRGNVTVIQGKSKVGKSAVVSAVLGAAIRGSFAAQGDTLCIEWAGEATGAVVHCDTEQSMADWHGLVSRAISRAGIAFNDRIVSLPLVRFSRGHRLQILRETLVHEIGQRAKVDLVVLDGVADLCSSPNDEAESLELVSVLMALAQEHHVAIVVVLHENPGTQDAKTRGHLGSELNRKAFANLRIDKDAETSVSTLYGVDMRKRDIPKSQGFCFAWDDSAGMHVFAGNAAQVKGAAIAAEASEKARNEWLPLFESIAGGWTNGGCPPLTVKSAIQAEVDIGRTAKPTKQETMEKRIQRATNAGFLRKSDAGGWIINPEWTRWT
jgi:hypothetical protein